jgi:hypothetical protein
MNLFGLFGKEKPVSFEQFRDMVRQAVRRNASNATIEPNPNGFTLRMEDRPPVTCNLRNLYATYSKAPKEKDVIIQNWLDSVVTDVPEHTWLEARATLRPTLKSAEYIALARESLSRQKMPDGLPSQPFVGDLHVIVVREVGHTLTGVTQLQLDEWGVPFEDTVKEALNNMGIMSFPVSGNALQSGGEEVGLVFQGDHLTATWLLLERFRDHIALRLQGNYVVTVPNRNRLTAVRADEPGLIASIMQGNRNFQRLPYPLTAQCYHVNVSTTGGQVTVYQPGGQGAALDPASPFAGKATAAPTAAAPAPQAHTRPEPVDFSKWGLTESTDDSSPSETAPRKRG